MAATQSPLPQDLHDEIVAALAQAIADAAKRQSPAWGTL